MPAARHYLLLTTLFFSTNINATNWFKQFLFKSSKFLVTNIVGTVLAIQAGNTIINFLVRQITHPNNIKLIQLRTQVYNAKLPKIIKTSLLNTIKSTPISAPQDSIEALSELIALALKFPWKVINPPQANLKRIENSLNATLFGLHTAKNLILDIIFAYNAGITSKVPPICLVGPPGVGKTAFATAVANALNLPSIVISATGLYDADVFFRGHSRTYTRSKPGFFVNAFTNCGCRNPVVVIDEIDKAASGKERGNVQNILLQVFDPVQNKNFRDHYLDMPLDISDALYITTANRLEDIIDPLKDRMLIIEIPLYSEKERAIIANTMVWHSISQTSSIPAHVRKAMIEDALQQTVNIRGLKKHLTQCVIRWLRTHAVDSAPSKSLN